MHAPAAVLARRSALALLLAACAAAHDAGAQAPKAAPAFEPTSFQPGKDVVWVPTPQVVVDKMLDMAKVTARDFVIDLGSGDGRTVITAAKRGARALGIEYNPEMVAYARHLAAKEGVAGKAEFVKADLFETDFSQASVITMFLLPDINLRLRPKILSLKPGTRIVSNTFTMGDWEADETADLSPGGRCDVSWCSALLWIVPAKVAGSYKLAQGEFTLKQDFQRLSGTMQADGKTYALEGRVNGEDIRITAGGRTYSGIMSNGYLVLK